MKLTLDDILSALNDATNPTSQGNPVALQELKISEETFLLTKAEALRLKVTEEVLLTALLNKWRNLPEHEQDALATEIQKVTLKALTRKIDLSPNTFDLASRQAIYLEIEESEVTIKAAMLVQGLITDWEHEPVEYRDGLAAEIKKYRDDLAAKSRDRIRL